MNWLFVLSLFLLGVGVTGFARRGLLFRAKKRMSGGAGVWIGSGCTALATSGILIAFWLGTSNERETMRLILLGICVGAAGTWLAMRQ